MVALPAADVELLQRDRRFEDGTRRGVCPPDGIFIPDMLVFLYLKLSAIQRKAG